MGFFNGMDKTKQAAAGIGMLVRAQWKNKIDSYCCINERILILRFKIRRGFMTVIGVYAPSNGNTMETEEFYKDLQCELNMANKTDYIIIAGDLNARIGKNPVLNVVGDNGEDVLNEKDDN
ncbi:hypothetical protein C0J52_21858 [Blattella germanica]|nr:hypothetical protein C0J52_21858 [Blattella germanica]